MAPTSDRVRADQWCAAAQEFILLAMLFTAPWAFGAEEPTFQGALLAGIAGLTFLATVRLLLAGRSPSGDCPVAFALGLLVLATACQLVPLPPAVLGAVSPASREMYGELLPERPESLADNAGAASSGVSWRPISLYPFGTRSLLVQLLALFLVAIIVRHQLAGRAFIQRLRWSALVNGSALSLFALTQAASSPANVVYWSIPTEGSVFGPFICRNHFPFYVSLCMGLAVGLLGNDWRHEDRRPLPGHHWAGPSSLLHDPHRLWVLCGLVLMGVACVFSLSRGAIVAMAVSAAMIAAIARWPSVRSRSLLLPAIGLALGAMLALWLGPHAIEARLATLDRSDAGLGPRLTLWRGTLPHFTRFPLLGSGGGTFTFLEPMYRTQSGDGEFFVAEFAHNEYLEAAFEGGLPRLAITVALVAILVGVVRRALRACPDKPSRAAMLGGLWAVLTVAIHSAVDFGLHIPAVGLLATVVATHLVVLASGTRRDPRPAQPGTRGVRLGLVLVGVPLSLLLAREGATIGLADHYRREAVALGRSESEDDRERQFDYWEAALALRPDDALMHQSAGRAYLERYLECEQQSERRDQLLRACRSSLLPRDVPVALIAADFMADIATGAFVAPTPASRAEAHLIGRLLYPSARHMLAARDLCPALADAHIQLAELGQCFAAADPSVSYLRRAARLRPSDPAIWFSLGRKYREADQPEQARLAWRRCLEQSDLFLPRILAAARGLLTLQEVCNSLLPERPQTWLTTADVLFPDQSGREDRRPFLEHALALLDGQSSGSAEQMYRKAKLQQELGKTAEAEASYRSALRQAPGRHDWRIEFTQFLRRLSRFREARSELETVLAQMPDHREAKELLTVVSREAKLHGNDPSP